MARSRGVTLLERPCLGFWTEWGGKLVLPGFLTLIISPVLVLRRA